MRIEAAPSRETTGRHRVVAAANRPVGFGVTTPIVLDSEREPESAPASQRRRDAAASLVETPRRSNRVYTHAGKAESSEATPPRKRVNPSQRGCERLTAPNPFRYPYRTGPENIGTV
ncbi:hypothetical protein GCM10009020_17840 [Natronoarchaeum mannanilyticum]|uniref:Uncharacterized protein n=1 Tax=Natronoarchaeum mannanilyticum TaxID=926360 RepID=A0AAV3T9T2_9EURY